MHITEVNQNLFPELGIEVGLSLPFLRLANELKFKGNIIIKQTMNSENTYLLNSALRRWIVQESFDSNFYDFQDLNKGG
jgi:hypothetical protein